MIAVNRNDAAALSKRGQLFVLRGNFPLAIRDFDAVLRVRPKDPEALDNRCWARALFGDLQGALRDCNEALQIRPRYADAFDSRGFVNLKIGRPDDAIADYDSALRINPKIASSLYGRGVAKLKSGKSADALGDSSQPPSRCESQQKLILQELTPRLFDSVKLVWRAIYSPANAAPLTAADFDDILDANFRGAFFTVQKALPLLSDGGAIVFTTSWFDEVGVAGTSAVSASKAALRNFTRTLASELIGRNFRVNAVSPGVIEAPLFGKLGLPETNAQELARACFNRSRRSASASQRKSP